MQTSEAVASDPAPRHSETQPKRPDLQEQISELRKELEQLVDFTEGLLVDQPRSRRLERGRRLRKFKDEEEDLSDGTVESVEV